MQALFVSVLKSRKTILPCDGGPFRAEAGHPNRLRRKRSERPERSGILERAQPLGARSRAQAPKGRARRGKNLTAMVSEGPDPPVGYRPSSKGDGHLPTKETTCLPHVTAKASKGPLQTTERATQPSTRPRRYSDTGQRWVCNRRTTYRGASVWIWAGLWELRHCFAPDLAGLVARVPWRRHLMSMRAAVWTNRTRKASWKGWAAP